MPHPREHPREAAPRGVGPAPPPLLALRGEVHAPRLGGLQPAAHGVRLEARGGGVGARVIPRRAASRQLGECDVSRGFRGGDLRLRVSRARLRGGERRRQTSRARFQSLQALGVVRAARRRAFRFRSKPLRQPLTFVARRRRRERVVQSRRQRDVRLAQTLGQRRVLTLQRRAATNLRSALYADPIRWMKELQGAVAFQLAQSQHVQQRDEELVRAKNVERAQHVERLQSKNRRLEYACSEHEYESGLKDRKLAASSREMEALRQQLVEAQRKQRNLERMLEAQADGGDASTNAQTKVRRPAFAAGAREQAFGAPEFSSSPGALLRPLQPSAERRRSPRPVSRGQPRSLAPALRGAGVGGAASARAVRPVDGGAFEMELDGARSSPKARSPPKALKPTESSYFARKSKKSASHGVLNHGIFKRRSKRPKTPGSARATEARY